MTRYNELEVKHDGKSFIFVTRGKSAPFTSEEATTYLDARSKLDLEEVQQPVELKFPNYPVIPMQDANFSDQVSVGKPIPIELVKKLRNKSGFGMTLVNERLKEQEDFRIPDDKMRRHIFRKDMALGIEFCTKKYGVSADAIQRESQRLASREASGG